MLIRLWRLLRTLSGIYFLVGGMARPDLLPVAAKYSLAFKLMGSYIGFLDLFALYIVRARGSPVRAFLAARYAFWQAQRERFQATHPLASDEHPIYIRCSGYKDWGAQRMVKERCGGSTWFIGLPLKVGEHEYVFECGGQFFDDPAAPKSLPNPYGGKNSVREVGYVQFPGARVQITNISSQVLIASAVAVLAFGEKTPPPLHAFDSAAISVVAGLVYNFIFGGSIVRERHDGEPHVVTVVGLHQQMMEMLLNVQVLALIFALVALTVG